MTYFLETDYREHLLCAGIKESIVTHLVVSHIRRFSHMDEIDLSDAFFFYGGITIQEFPELKSLLADDDEE